VQQEMERERAKLEKERQHHANAIAALVENGDEGAAERLREELEEIDQRLEDVDYRAANIRAGYVYVISNLGSFGERIVKVGLTRRLKPLDRIRELGDASVPFKFDIHALFFSKDAVGIEAELHRRLADRRVNLVNTRREFFYVTPVEVKQHLLELTGELIEYQDLPEALEYRQSARLSPSPEERTRSQHEVRSGARAMINA
jgi:seryl-tRNA synthetase